MPQLSLFDSGAGALVDDATGRIEYVPGFVSPQVAAGWFAELREAVDWEAGRRFMYDREVDVPRLTAHFAKIDSVFFAGSYLLIKREFTNALSRLYNLSRL